MWFRCVHSFHRGIELSHAHVAERIQNISELNYHLCHLCHAE